MFVCLPEARWYAVSVAARFRARLVGWRKRRGTERKWACLEGERREESERESGSSWNRISHASTMGRKRLVKKGEEFEEWKRWSTVQNCFDRGHRDVLFCIDINESKSFVCG